MMNDFMTGTLLFSPNYKPVLSPMSVGFFDDTGWYQMQDAKIVQYAAEFGYAQTLTWGWQAGCSFVTRIRYSTVNSLYTVLMFLRDPY
jgi:hypothetical protein